MCVSDDDDVAAHRRFQLPRYPAHPCAAGPHHGGFLCCFCRISSAPHANRNGLPVLPGIHWELGLPTRILIQCIWLSNGGQAFGMYPSAKGACGATRPGCTSRPCVGRRQHHRACRGARLLTVTGSRRRPSYQRQLTAARNAAAVACRSRRQKPVGHGTARCSIPSGARRTAQRNSSDRYACWRGCGTVPCCGSSVCDLAASWPWERRQRWQ